MKSDKEIFNNAKQLHQSGKIEEAQKLYLKIIDSNQNNFQLFFLLGTSFLQIKEYSKAINYLDKAINLNSNFADAFNNRGIALAEIKKYSDAIKNYDQTIKLNEKNFSAYLNKGIALKNLKQYKKAIECYDLGIKLNPKNSEIYNNLGNVFKEQLIYDKAVICYNKAIKLNQNYAKAYNNLGIIFQAQNKFKDAAINYSKALSLDQNLENLLGNNIYNNQFICNWNHFDEELIKIKKGIIDKKSLIDPFIFLGISDNAQLHKLNAEILINKKFNKPNKIFHKTNLGKSNKIKIGYYSAEFHRHPVLLLMMDVFKNHDKSSFEIFAFSHGPSNKERDPWRKLIKPYFDGFYEISEKSTEDIVNFSRKLKIDIAINLTGLTENNRTDIFMQRVAPIQINYLGYPGTLGTNLMDYIIADKIIIPDHLKKNYSEKVLYLPNCYQPNASNLFTVKKKTKKEFFRFDFGLPKNDIVFCSFNSNYKITPIIFNAWMNILRKVKKSVLWIYAYNELARQNLKLEAKKRGVDPKRIIFAEKVSILEDHLQRIKLADIFLDTFPYNAHTSASDSIRMGLPLITMKGNSFASRVAASILSSINMSELITDNIDDYENLAIELGNNKFKLNEIKENMIGNVQKSNFFNSEIFTKELESIYKDLIKKN